MWYVGESNKRSEGRFDKRMGKVHREIEKSMYGKERLKDSSKWHTNMWLKGDITC